MARDRSIDAYRQKRDFGRTPEPAPEDSSADERARGFVVHRHEARRLHYDLRLQSGNVLKCFAIPKGFSFVPEDKHLAMRTEDHPLEYVEFRGRIPRGEYGGGTMLIWDQGTYEIVKAPGIEEAVAQGEVKVILRGKRLRGEWHLVRTSQEKEQWLIFKSKDTYARSRNEAPPPALPEAATAASMPGRLQRMLPKSESVPFDDPAWGFEIEFSGRRILARRNARGVELEGLETNPALKGIVAALEKLHAQNVIVDGVLTVEPTVATAEEVLSLRLREGNAQGVVFYAVDLLYFEEWDLRPVPLSERKQMLAAIIAPGSLVLHTDPVVGRGTALAEAARGAGVTALLAKRLDSAYRSGKQAAWIRIPMDAEPTAAAARKPGGAPARASIAPEGSAKRVALRNLEKIYFPGEGITKGELVQYYATVAETLLPYLRDRPVHLLRYPDGIEGKFFYQKQVMEYVPDWIRTVSVGKSDEGQDVRYIVCEDAETLLYLVNLGSIDLHPWMSRTGSMESPDWAFIDLDPKEAPFGHVVRLAKQTGRLLRGIGVTPFVKTSGKTGMHIAIPLLPGYTYEQSRMFCESIARVLVRENRDIATVERRPGSRGGRVYVDFLQNRKEQTIVPPYVVRPVPGARVSMPLEWDELEGDLETGLFTIRTAPPRIERLGDLWRASLSVRHDLVAAIVQLEEYVRSGGG